MAKDSSVVASVTQQSRQSSIVSDRVQKTSEGHMSSDGTMAWGADDQRRCVHAFKLSYNIQMGHYMLVGYLNKN